MKIIGASEAMWNWLCGQNREHALQTNKKQGLATLGIWVL
jgi:hypothetical protein